jgi:hypothetical protein
MENSMEGGNSIFNKIDAIKTDKIESENTSKEKMYEEARGDIKNLEQEKREILDLYEKINTLRKEFSGNHEEYKTARDGMLAVFDSEEAKKALNEQDIDTVKDILNAYPDTDEAQALQNAENSVKGSIESLKMIKADVIEKFEINNPQYKSVSGVATYLSFKERGIEEKIQDTSIDTPEGRESWPIYYLSGSYYEETNFEKNIKEKEPKIREVYHELGDKIDTALLESMEEYNTKITDPSENMKMKSDYKEGRHVINRSSIGVKANEIEFHFGRGYSSLEYKITEHNGQLFFSRKGSYKSLHSDKFLAIVNEKLRDIDNSFKSVAESI